MHSHHKPLRVSVVVVGVCVSSVAVIDVGACVGGVEVFVTSA